MGKINFFNRKNNSALLRFLTYGLITFLIVIISAFILSLVIPVSAQPTISPTTKTKIEQTVSTKKPKSCNVGAYVISLYDFDLVDKSFGAGFWLWSICPSADIEPLKFMDIINGKDVKTSLDSTLKIKNSYWSYMKVNGTFRYNWDVRNFPFDQHVLPIILGNSSDTSENFIYTPDRKGSKYNQTMQLDGWQINNFTVTENSVKYDTNFGDPNLSETETTNFSHFNILISIARNSPISFFKLSVPVYIAFGISLPAYFLNTSSALGLLAGALFSVVVHQQSSESLLGNSEGLTMIDQIHIAAMAYILVATVLIVKSHIKSELGEDQSSINRHRLSFHIAWISFIVVNIIIVIVAKITG